MISVPRSIAVRLTAGLGVIALVVFAGTGVFLQRTLERSLTAVDRQELLGKLDTIRHFIDESSRTGDLQNLSHHLDDLRIGHRRLSIRVLASDGTDYYRGTGLPVATTIDSSGFGRVLRDDGVPFDTLQAELGSESPWPGGRIVLGLDARPREQLLARHQSTLTIVGALAIVLMVFLGAIAAWRGLAPVSRLSQQAGRITAHSLGARLVDHHDASELVGLVMAFNAVLDRLEAAYHQMESFSANVAHELRTPLATLISSSQLMLSGRRTVEDLEETIGSNLEEIERMSQLVNDMLFLAGADQGERAQELALVDLAAEADRTLNYCEQLLREGGLTGSRIGQAAIECNPALVQRALVNLIANAIRHTESGQRIVVAIESLATGIRLSVENPGPEIPVDVRAHMFDRFFRADGARARATGGHGLGLTIVAAVARMHGGTVFVERTSAANCVGLMIPRLESTRDAAAGSADVREAAAPRPGSIA
jgi:two-component system heavy metal sensor histidine kinase CusS